MATGTGTATLNFGAAPGTNVATATVTGQTGITTSSHAEAWIMGDSTSDHNAYEHLHIFPQRIGLACGDLVLNTGFTIYAETELRLTGSVAVHYVWST